METNLAPDKKMGVLETGFICIEDKLIFDNNWILDICYFASFITWIYEDSVISLTDFVSFKFMIIVFVLWNFIDD